MGKILRSLKKIWFLNFLLRIRYASKYYNRRYCQILSWGFRSREDTNFTYHLTRANLDYLAHTLSVVTGENTETIKKYFDELLTDEELKNSILTSTRNSSYRKFADEEVRYARRIGWYAFVRVMKPSVVVETGVDKGLGSMVLCSALLRNRAEGKPGKYYGTDINPEAGYLLTGTWRETGEILFGDSIESLVKLQGPIDLFINDSDHSAEYEYREYLTVKEKLSEKGIILGDNSHSSNKLSLFSAETGRKFLFFKEEPENHWYPGAGIGISYK